MVFPDKDRRANLRPALVDTSMEISAVQALFNTRRGRWILFILGWTALSLLFAPEAYLSFRLRHTPISWGETLQLTLVNAVLALLFIPAIIALAQRFPFERKRLVTALAVHIPAC